MQGPLKKFSRISTRARLCDNLPRNAAGQELENPAAQTLCEPAQSKCTNMLQEQFLGENLQENIGAQDREAHLSIFETFVSSL